MDNINERLKQIRSTLSFTQDDFSSKLGIRRATLSRIENGDRNVTERIIKDVCREFNVDYLWFTTGKGEMFSPADDAIMARIDNIMMGDSFAREVFKRAALLDEEDWLEIEKIAKKLLEPKNE